MTQIIAELITAESSEENTELHFYDIENLDSLEMDKRLVKRIKRNVAMLMELTDGETEYNYDFPRRTRFEVEAGYRLALAKDARLNETKVFNVVFRFRNRKIDAFALAVMYRPPHNKEEWIMLMPDDTETTIKVEREAFLQKARQLLQYEMISQTRYNELIHNLDRITLAERCAQTLQHEFGHVLHWREFDRLGIYEMDEIYRWFYESGYAELLMFRFPPFGSLQDEEKVYFLKEALVEDYRVFLNLRSKGGIFIMPSKITFSVDLSKPKLMEEGVRIMETMLSEALAGKLLQKNASQQREIDTVSILNFTHDWIVKNNWKPGVRTMSKEDHLAVIERLRQKSLSSMVAVARD